MKLSSRGRTGVGRRAALAGAVDLLAAPALVRAQGQNGVALVIGNSKYRWEASLPNVGRDAPDIAKRFQALGLRTELVQNAGRDAMLAAIDRFKSAATGANLAAFYFAGHGVSWEKQTFVVPADADLSDPKAAQSLITVAAIDDAMKAAANRFLVFDSCRNSPADGWRQREARAQARSDADDKVAVALRAPNTLSLFSTASGAIALDGPAGGNSPFAAALLRQLDAPSVDLQALPAKLRRDLLLATECRQLVWDQNTYSAPFVVNGSGKSAPGSGARPDPSWIVELPNAYAYVQKVGLVLPPGLVAYRPAPGAVAARLIGSYKFDSLVPASRTPGTTYVAPTLLIVLSVPAGDTVEVIGSAKDYTNGSGARWRSSTVPKTENRIVIRSVDEFSQSDFAWRDQNSGVFSISGGGNGSFNASQRTFPFTRLDG